MKHLKIKLYLISKEFFQYSLITYLILLLAETLQSGFASYFFNLNILLIVVFVSGISMVLTNNEIIETANSGVKKITRHDVQYGVLFAIVGSVLVYYKTEILGEISLIIAGITGVVIILLSLILFTDQKE